MINKKNKISEEQHNSKLNKVYDFIFNKIHSGSINKVFYLCNKLQKLYNRGISKEKIIAECLTGSSTDGLKLSIINVYFED